MDRTLTTLMNKIISKKLPLITSCRFFSSFFRLRNSSLGMIVSNAGRSSSTFKSSDSSALNCEPEGRLILPGSGENLSANNDVYQLKYDVEDMHTQVFLSLNSLEFFHLLCPYTTYSNKNLLINATKYNTSHN